MPQFQALARNHRISISGKFPYKEKLIIAVHVSLSVVNVDIIVRGWSVYETTASTGYEVWVSSLACMGSRPSLPRFYLAALEKKAWVRGLDRA